MTAHERIIATIERRPTDRPPVDLWLTPEALASLKSHVGESEEFALYRRLEVDRIVWVFPGYGTERFDPNDSEGRDPWGVPTIKVQSGLATYQEYGPGPLAGFDDPSDLDDYPFWPDPEKFNLDAARRQAEDARRNEFATVGPWLSFFEIYCHLRGMETALMDLLTEPEFLARALDKIEQIQTRLLERFLNGLGDLVDIVFISDDMGTQESQLISTDAFVEHFKPRLSRWCRSIHKHGKKVLFHTDGAASAFIPHLIECGVDILNPIQHICPGMDCADLKRTHGDDLVFHGGIENQHVLPHGTVEDVKRETRHCLETLGEGGGYIACSCHNIQAGTPPENILAMIRAVHKWAD